MSSLHTKRVDFTGRELPKWGMAESNKSLANRLKLTREALDLKPAEVCKVLKVGANAWSQYESGERRITIRVAIKFSEAYGLTLDWIYRADPSRLPHEIRLKLPSTAA
jgi:transcriptional regulator with XRE-family HTH domain